MSANVNPNLANWSTTASSNRPDGTDAADIDAELRQIQAVVRKYLANKGSDIASATTVDLSTATGNYVHITGSTGPITSFGTVSAGIRFLLVFDSTPTITHNGTSLILPGTANIVAEAGDSAEVVSLGAGNWRCLWYTRASGTTIASYQPLDATLTAFAGGLTAANKIPYATALNTLSELDYIDDDSMATAGATKVASSESVKAYVDNVISNAALATLNSSEDYILFEDATDNTQKKALASAITSLEKSGDLLSANTLDSYSTDKTYSVAHGLSGVPIGYTVGIRCVSDDIGYSTNDEVMLNGGVMGSGTQAGNAWANSTYVGFTMTNAFSSSIVSYVVNKTTGVTGSLTTTKWKFILRAWK